MALIRTHSPHNERAPIRIGDATYDYRPGRTFELHAGVVVSLSPNGPGSVDEIFVRSLPGRRGRDEELLSAERWGVQGAWRADIIGQRLDVDPVRVKMAALLSDAVQLQHSQLSPEDCCWSEVLRVDKDRPILDGIPLFLSGTCAHFVEYLYQHSGLDIVDENVTHSTQQPERLFPATQVHAFWTGKYPLSLTPWNPKLEKYSTCLFGDRALSE